MAGQMLAALPHASAVVDEPAHLTAGYLALARGDLTVNREHPPLVKVLAAAPLLLARPDLPPEPPGSPPRASEDFEFDYSRRFLYKANDADRLLGLARLPVVGLMLLAGLVAWLWGAALYRDAGLGGAAPLAGLLALWLMAFEPNLLAHGRLVTTDMGATLFALAAFACLERSCAHPGPAATRWAAAAGACLGLGMLSRFSCLLLLPLAAAALLLDRRRPAGQRVRRFLVAAACALLLVNLGYGFAGSPFPLAGRPAGGPLRTELLASMEASPTLRWLPIPLPRIYLEGLDLARHKNQLVEGPGYLNGAYSSEGWWSYFVLALAMKTTLPLLALSAGGLVALAAGAGGIARATLLAYVALPAAGFLFLVTALTRAQIGLRYVLPVIPFLCLAAPAVLAPLARMRRAAWLLPCSLLAWHAWAAVAIHPHHLAYFNEAAGGPERGYLRLVDSNLDWGQDLVGLKRFMEARGVERINLYYFGTADPEYYGIRRALPPEPGFFAVSATHLMGVYLPDPDYLAPFRAMRPVSTIGHSILIYHLDDVPEFLRLPPKNRTGRPRAPAGRRGSDLPILSPGTRFVASKPAARRGRGRTISACTRSCLPTT